MSDPIRRRDDEDAERELRVNRTAEPPPGGAEGGDESPSADLPMGLPADDRTPVGDTDQHSDRSNLSPPREQDDRARRD